MTIPVGIFRRKRGLLASMFVNVCQPLRMGVVNLEQISLLANTEDSIVISGNIVYANGIPIWIKENGGDITSVLWRRWNTIVW